MVFTNDDYLPSKEELSVKELELTTVALKAGSLYFGAYCDNHCKEFMLCSSEYNDPRKCLNEGKEVTRCAFDFFKKVKKNCLVAFTQFSECLDWNGSNMRFEGCRQQQAELDKCMKDKAGIARPEIGHFSKVRVHATDRPKPPPVEDHLPKEAPAAPDFRKVRLS